MLTITSTSTVPRIFHYKYFDWFIHIKEMKHWLLAVPNFLWQLPLVLLVALAFTPCVGAAHSSPCSLNGELVEGTCLCNKPWTGTDCGILDLLPVTFPQGYGMVPRPSFTWGADVIRQDDAKAKYHMFVSAITGNCSLRSWNTHSRIEHAVADTVTGPYQFHSVALPTFSHNPKLIRLQKSNNSNVLLALIHIGDATGPENAGGQCRKPPFALQDQQQQQQRQRQRQRQEQRHLLQGSSHIHTSTSVNGPWTPLLNNTLTDCNNPAPFVYDHKIFMVCSAANHSRLLQANDIWGPWTTISQITPFPDEALNGIGLYYEDPALYINERGYHVLYHLYDTQENPPPGHDCTRTTISAHVYSSNGIDWYKSQGQPYSSQVEVLQVQQNTTSTSTSTSTATTRITVATRERPAVVFDASGQRMTHLITAVCSAEACPRGPPEGCVNCKYDHWDYTLIQPLNVE
jgi:hypothetical protein